MAGRCNESSSDPIEPNRKGYKPKLTHGDKFMPPGDVAKLLDVAKAAVNEERSSPRRKAKKAERNYLIIAVALNAGLRASELASLKVKHLRLDDSPSRIVVEGGKGRKAGAERLTHDVDEVVIGFDLAELLRAWIANLGSEEPVFWSERKAGDGGKRTLSRQGIWTAIKGLMKAAGLNELFSTHTLRHRFITAEVEAQERRGVAVNPYFVAQRARHRSLDSTLSYIHNRQSEVEEHMKARRAEL